MSVLELCVCVEGVARAGFAWHLLKSVPEPDRSRIRLILIQSGSQHLRPFLSHVEGRDVGLPGA